MTVVLIVFSIPCCDLTNFSVLFTLFLFLDFLVKIEKIDVKLLNVGEVARVIKYMLRYCWASSQFLSRSVAYN